MSPQCPGFPDFGAIINSHPEDEGHDELVASLKQFGLSAVEYRVGEQGPEKGLLEMFEVHNRLFAVNLAVFTNPGFKFLKVLNLSQCVLVSGPLEDLTILHHLEELHLWRCRQVTGFVSSTLLCYISGLRKKVLYGCGRLRLDPLCAKHKHKVPTSRLATTFVKKLAQGKFSATARLNQNIISDRF